MKKYCWIIILFIAQFSFGQSKADMKDIGKEFEKNGQWYAKCLVQTHKAQEETYPVFTGETKKRGVRVKSKTLVLREGISNWEKKGRAKNCKSPDPNDCMVVCYVEKVPVQTASFQYVKNIKKTDEYKMQTFTVYKKVKSSYEVVPIVGQADLDDELLNNVLRQLDALGYEPIPDATTNELQKLEKMLATFQRDNDLPIGKFDHVTLKKLNIKPELYLR